MTTNLIVAGEGELWLGEGCLEGIMFKLHKRGRKSELGMESKLQEVRESLVLVSS
jgi:hypothetical protein